MEALFCFRLVRFLAGSVSSLRSEQVYALILPQALREELNFSVGFGFGEVGFNEFEVIVVEMRLDVGVFQCAAIEGIEVVDTDDRVAVD